MISRIMLVVLVLALIAISAGWASAVGEDAVLWPRMLMGAAVFFGGVGFGQLTKYAAKRNRADGPESMERELSVRVRASVFNDSLVILSLTGLLLLVLKPEINVAFVVFGVVAVLTADFYVRYLIATRRSVRV